MTTLITGVAGFIGSHLAKSLLDDGDFVIGIDNLNDYYSVELKRSRLQELRRHQNFKFEHTDISDLPSLKPIFEKNNINTIFHLAAQAGVRLQISEFNRYIESNLTGFANVSLSAIQFSVGNFIYASSSSVYGDSERYPYSEKETGLTQKSFYGATKFSNEILSQALARNSQTKFRGLRFFTVYGPKGRPDMAYFKLLNSALNGNEFHLFGDGSIKRDFTYIADVVTAIKKLDNELSLRNEGYSDVVNVGGGKPHSMHDLITSIEKISGNKINVIEQQPEKTDVKETIADHKLQEKLIGFVPQTTLDNGILELFKWANTLENKKNINDWSLW